MSGAHHNLNDSDAINTNNEKPNGIVSLGSRLISLGRFNHELNTMQHIHDPFWHQKIHSWKHLHKKGEHNHHKHMHRLHHHKQFVDTEYYPRRLYEHPLQIRFIKDEFHSRPDLHLPVTKEIPIHSTITHTTAEAVIPDIVHPNKSNNINKTNGDFPNFITHSTSSEANVFQFLLVILSLFLVYIRNRGKMERPSQVLQLDTTKMAVGAFSSYLTYTIYNEMFIYNNKLNAIYYPSNYFLLNLIDVTIGLVLQSSLLKLSELILLYQSGEYKDIKDQIKYGTSAKHFIYQTTIWSGICIFIRLINMVIVITTMPWIINSMPILSNFLSEVTWLHYGLIFMFNVIQFYSTDNMLMSYRYKRLLSDIEPIEGKYNYI